MSITGLPGQGPVRVGIPVADLMRRPVLRARHPDGAAGARGVRRGPVGADLAAAGADLHARLPGRALADRRARSPKQAGNNHPTSIPTGVFKTTDGHINIAAAGQAIWERFCKAHRAPRPARATRTTRPARCARRTATRSTPRSTPITRDKHQRRVDRAAQRGRRAVRADLLHRPGVRRPAGAASRHRADRRKRGRQADARCVGQPVTLSRTPSKIVAPPPGRGRAHRRGADGIRLQRRTRSPRCARAKAI